MPLRYLICLAAVASLALAVALSVGTRPTHAAELPTAISQSTSSQTAGSQTTDPQTADPQTTPEHLRASAWWPTKSLPNLDAYAGTAACATCHADIVASQATSQMARTLTPAAHSTVLNQHLQKIYHSGPYTYSLAKSPGKKSADISVSVSDGVQQQSAILQWALGSGDVGQSYLWQKDGAFYESRFNSSPRWTPSTPPPAAFTARPSQSTWPSAAPSNPLRPEPASPATPPPCPPPPRST